MIRGNNIRDDDVVGERIITILNSREKHNRQTIIDIRSVACRCPSTLAVTSCECERSISHLRIRKTHPRGTMPESRLVHGLALRQSDIACDVATVVEEYETNVDT